MGGWCSGDAISSVERFEPRNNEWRMVSPMLKRRCGVGVAVLNNLLYAVGGHDGQSYLNSIERFESSMCLRSLQIHSKFIFGCVMFMCYHLPCRYDPQTNQWSSDVAPTTSCRTSVGVAVLDGFLYAVGGQDGVSCLNYVEKYDPESNKWSKVANMTTRRLGVGVAVLNGCLYAVGGSDGTSPLNTGQLFYKLVRHAGNLARLL